MDTKEKLEGLLLSLNIYEFEIFSFNDTTKEIDFFVLIDYVNELLDNPNYEFEKFLKEKCAFYYDRALHSRLTLAPQVRASFEGSLSQIVNGEIENNNFEFFTKFSSEIIDYKTENDLKTKFIDLTRAFLIRVLQEL